MAFTDDFTGTNGDRLGVRTGWTQIRGTVDDAGIASNQVNRIAITGGVGAVAYATANDGSLVQSAGADLLGSAFGGGPFIFGTVNGSGQFSGYYLRVQTAGTNCRVMRVVDDVVTTFFTPAATADLIGMEMRGTVDGLGRPVIAVYRQGVLVTAATTDTAASRPPTTGSRRGIYFVTTSTSAMDNYFDDSSSGATTHDGTGVLAGPGAVVVGTSNRFRAFASSGVLTGPGSTLSSSANRYRVFSASGVLTGQGSALAGTALRYRTFSASGALVGAGAQVIGTAVRTGFGITHTASGTIQGQGSTIYGTVTVSPRRLRENPEFLYGIPFLLPRRRFI